jgi:hypothetical protein
VRKFPVAIVVLLLVATACGGGKKQSALMGASGSTASPGANASAAPSKSSAPSKGGGSKSATGSASGGSSQQAAGTPAKVKVVAGGYAPPKDGDYVYRYDGEATNPFNPAAPPQKFSNETLTKSVSHKGNVITTVQTSSTQAGRQTQRLQWETNRVLLLYFSAETPQGDFSCTFSPPLVVQHFPLHSETIPTQNFKGQGNACSGKIDITVERQEAAKDATGRSWPAWRERLRLQTNPGQFSQSSDTTMWLATALAMDVRSQGTSQYSIKGAGGTQGGHGSSQTALKSHP